MLVTHSHQDYEKFLLEKHDHDVKQLFNASNLKNRKSVDSITIKNAERLIRQLTDPIFPKTGRSQESMVRKIKIDGIAIDYCIFLSGREKEGIPLFKLNQLSNLWQIDQGKIQLHTSGVVHKGKLFLFGGPSGVGKSIITKISEKHGDWTL